MNISKLIEKGDDALKKRNYDYAISIFLEAVSFAPNNRQAREGLRRAEFKKYEAAYPHPVAVAIFGLGARVGMLVARLSRKANPEGYMMACERFLTKDPKNYGVNMALGNAAAEAGHLDTAIFAFETAAEHRPDDVLALKRLGNLLWQSGEINRAHSVYDRVVRLAPQDQEAVKARKNLAAEASLKETGFETAASSRDLVKDKEALGRLAQAERLYRTEEDLDAQKSELERRIEAEPGNVALLQELATVLAKRKDYVGALAAMDRAVAARPNDHQVLFHRGDIRLNQLEEAVYELERAGKEAEAEARRRELMDTRVEEFRQRVRVYPTDLKLRYQLGVLYLERGQTDEAIAQFQQTVRDPKYRSESQLRLGRAFAAKGQPDLAVRQLEQALEGQAGMSERVKEIHYELGNVYEQMGQAQKARAEFARIYEVDINYQDVSARIAKLDSAT